MKIGRLEVKFAKKEAPKFESLPPHSYYNYLPDSRIINEIVPKSKEFIASFEDYNEIYFSDNNIVKMIDRIAGYCSENVNSNPLNLDIEVFTRNFFIHGYSVLFNKQLVDLITYRERKGNYLLRTDGEKLDLGQCQFIGKNNYISLKNSSLYSILLPINAYKRSEEVYLFLLNNPIPDTFIAEQVPYTECQEDELRKRQIQMAKLKNEAGHREYDIPSSFESVNNYIRGRQNMLNNRVYLTANPISGFQVKMLNISELNRKESKEIYESEVVKPFDYPVLLISNNAATYNNLQTSANDMLTDCLNTNLKKMANELNGIVTFKNI